MKLLALAALSLIGASVPVEKFPDPADVTFKLRCRGDDGRVIGTGFYINDHYLATAAHVAKDRLCSVEGEEAPTVYADGDADIAVIRTESVGPGRIPISCKKPSKGKAYTAIGFPGGMGMEKRAFVGTGNYVSPDDKKFHGMARFDGAAAPGMSGSAILRNGRVVGILTATSNAEMLGRSLSDTWLCK